MLCGRGESESGLELGYMTAEMDSSQDGIEYPDETVEPGWQELLV